ncbi:hypothetical protein [Microvirga sesbaniae]|uniref:hypothetical protein n=1 Tax=Microvirga sesbaniae TaxID=681392 RepID=UPI0021CA8CE7|nr:hypothetical protein [Microvirga sp. HBU67692]
MRETLSQSQVAEIMLSLVPPPVQAALLNDLEFLTRYGLATEATVTFGGSPPFSRSLLFQAIREAFGADTSSSKIAAEDGSVWHLSVHDKDGQRVLRFSAGEHGFIASQFWPLSPSREDRMIGFNREAEAIGLTDSAAEHWRAKLSSSAVSDDEFDKLQSEFNNTPVRSVLRIEAELRARSVNISSLVPIELRYYERLVGACEPDMTLSAFVASMEAEHLSSLMRWRRIEVLRSGLLLSWHSSLVGKFPTFDLAEEDIQYLYAWLLQKGDLVSCLGAIEFSLAHLDRFPRIESKLPELIDKLWREADDNESGRFNLLSCLCCLVLGEMARRGIGRDRPPFWRRLAAFAQASLIERAVIATGLDISSFAEWALKARGQIFYLQTMVDLRREPRWLPDFISSDQLKAEFLGRISAVARRNEFKITDPMLRERLLGDSGLQRDVQFPFSYLPGPMEGGTEAVAELPHDLVETLEQQLSSDVLGPNSFAPLLNSTLLYRITPDHAQLAADALRRVKYQIMQIGDERTLFSLLSGLATVGAVTRSQQLADEVRVLARVIRRRSGPKLPRDNELRVALIAAASYLDAGEWACFLGDWLTEMAQEPLTATMATSLYAHIRHLQNIEPILRRSCAKADAALLATANQLNSNM